MIETIAREVIGADVDDERITCRKGCSKEGMSKLLISREDEHLLMVVACHWTDLCSP